MCGHDPKRFHNHHHHHYSVTYSLARSKKHSGTQAFQIQDTQCTTVRRTGEREPAKRTAKKRLSKRCPMQTQRAIQIVGDCWSQRGAGGGGGGRIPEVFQGHVPKAQGIATPRSAVTEKPCVCVCVSMTVVTVAAANHNIRASRRNPIVEERVTG